MNGSVAFLLRLKGKKKLLFHHWKWVEWIDEQVFEKSLENEHSKTEHRKLFIIHF